MVSIKDIARQAGVSPATVSRAVNGKQCVCAKTKEQILKIVEKTGYVPNKAARAMVLRRSFTVGIVIPWTFNVFQRQLFPVVEEQLNLLGYETLFFFVKPGAAGERECLNRLKSEDLDGIVVFHEIKDPQFYLYLAGAKLPAVSTLDISAAISVVQVDDKRAAYDAVRYLIGLGHRKIGLICTSQFSFGKRRAEGYFLALEKNNIPRDEKRVVFEPYYSPEFGVKGMRELLSRSQDFSAVFAVTDELAIGTVRTLKDAGFRIPEDVSVVGFDDTETAGYMVPRLTTIRQPLREIGKQTALILHNLVEGGTTIKQILSYELIIRESTGEFREKN
ncbi:MAG: LacI family transcriptional regulator [Treponema sp.]|jgi:LacI family transcriptional regulator|nr:LacI family transcriptional regulator [Treponema sp.]